MFRSYLFVVVRLQFTRVVKSGHLSPAHQADGQHTHGESHDRDNHFPWVRGAEPTVSVEVVLRANL